MLDELPAEITEAILSYLPTLTSITNVAKTNKKLNAVVKNGSNPIFHGFVQRQFPTIAADAPWRVAAIRLASRSRAWDRRALVARECIPPVLEAEVNNQPLRNQGGGGRQTFGYMPVIDSYEVGYDREVLAWGAAGRIYVRTTDGRSRHWAAFCFPSDSSPVHDILDLKLLRPHQNRNEQGDSIFIRKANRELALLHNSPETGSWTTRSRFLVQPEVAIDCVDVSDSEDPLLAVCNSESLHLYSLLSEQEECAATTILPFADSGSTRQRKRCAKFLSPSKIAVAPQYLTGVHAAPIEIFNIGESAISSDTLAAIDELSAAKPGSATLPGRIGANVISKVSVTNGQYDSNILLTGWSDGLVRLYDLRAGQCIVREFSDPVDGGQIFSLLSIGQERFLAGSHQNGCLKTFDMRFGGRVYDYRDVSSPGPQVDGCPAQTKSRPVDQTARDINIFLAFTMNNGRQWRPISEAQGKSSLPRYNGSVYSLSSPSPSSQTVYAGIENHVIQLDSVSSNDWAAGTTSVIDEDRDRKILNLSCYERPREGYESTDTVLLRKQSDLDRQHFSTVEAGWDERWFIGQRGHNKTMAMRWRRNRS